MNKIYLFIVGSLLFINANAQTNQEPTIQSINSRDNVLKIENSNSLEPVAIIDLIKNYYELNDAETFLLKKEELDDLGFTHYRYAQYHNSIKVEGASLFIHIAKEGSVVVNSKLVKDIENDGQEQLSEESALLNAIRFIDAKEYYWEDPAMESLLKELKKDENATFYPEGELVFASENRDQEGSKYTLNWKFEIYANGERMRTFVYVDATTGQISYSLNGIHEDAVEGVAQTRYHGEQVITTDSTGSSNNDYILYDNTRGDGIKTLNMQEGVNYSAAVNFTDADNDWDNANDAVDEVAGDTHWSMEMTYDYFKDTHNHNSYDNWGSEIISYIHYDVDYFNAFWNGLYMTFGDGSFDPLTSIDVVGHEFSHGVTEYSAGLVYQNESGALNESFSDIFGTAIEFNSLVDSLTDWRVGAATFKFRNMQDPNDYDQPDTYNGSHWYDGEFDNGGVHTNSGVQNFWFYLLSEGGTGINDNGDVYDVDGIGMDKAAKIAFRNLIYYLSENSDYIDAYELSVQSAEDLYGSCSEEVRQTIKAWYAVGIGVNELSKDMSVKSVVLPSSSCYLTENESLVITFKYQNIGCGESLPSGTTIPFSYRINEDTPITTEMVLTEDLQSGDTLNYTFDGTVDLSAFGRFYIDFWVSYADDLITFNDTVHNRLITHQVQLASEDVVGFESYNFSPDSFYTEIGAHAELKISSTADNTGSKGLKMTGHDVDAEEIEIPTDEEDNFSFNPEYNSKVCFCVDASDWGNVRLSFDMKQLHSEYWMELYGEDMPEHVSSMRLLINDEQVGEQYHPTTYQDDPYLTHYVNLDDYAGSVFEACFQTNAYIRKAEDPVSGSKGDNTYLDNIRFIDNSIVKVDEISESVFSIYPNPTNSTFYIQVVDIDTDYSIDVIDALGRVLYSFQKKDAINEVYKVDMQSYKRGMYIVRIQTEETIFSKRVILN